MKKLHAHWGERVQFVDVVIRQAHPGPSVPPYDTFEEKLHDAHRYQQEEGISWPVVVDDLKGTVHQVYSGLADPTYLIDVDGRVAYFNMWTYAPGLYVAIEELLARGGRGVVHGGIDHVPHVAAAMTDGWKGIRRGLPQSFIDLETASPGMGMGIWLGYQLRPVLAPLSLRAKPLSSQTQAAIGAGLIGFGLAALFFKRRASDRDLMRGERQWVRERPVPYNPDTERAYRDAA